MADLVSRPSDVATRLPPAERSPDPNLPIAVRYNAKTTPYQAPSQAAEVFLHLNAIQSRCEICLCRSSKDVVFPSFSAVRLKPPLLGEGFQSVPRKRREDNMKVDDFNAAKAAIDDAITLARHLVQDLIEKCPPGLVGLGQIEVDLWDAHRKLCQLEVPF
jgi:hypothetical protein